MRVRVVRHLVPGGSDRPDKSGVDPGVFADDKERRARPVCGQQLENARGVFRVRTVINGQPDFPPRGREAPMHAHQSLRPGGEHVIGQQ